MRYSIVSEVGWGSTLWYIFDDNTGQIVGNTYMNKYSVQTECDRLNGIEEVV